MNMSSRSRVPAARILNAPRCPSTLGWCRLMVRKPLCSGAEWSLRHESLPEVPGSASRTTRPGAGFPKVENGGCKRKCRSEEHTSELQSRPHLVCRLLLEKKKKKQKTNIKKK